MSLIVDSTNYETSYGFKILRDGVTVNPAPARRVTIQIPGVEGELYQGLELGPRPIQVRGVVVGTTQADMYTKLISLEADLIGSFSSAPANFLSPTRVERTVTIENFGGKKFPNCSYDSIDIDYVGPRGITYVCVLTIRFIQSRPFTTAV